MTDLYRINGGVPGPLPPTIYSERGEAYTAPFSPADMAVLKVTLAPAKPAFDPATQTVVWTANGWKVEALPPEPPQPAPEPKILGKLEFITLAQSAGGLTDAMLIAAYKHPALEAFWVKYQMASAVERDNLVTRQALGALQALDYLPNGAEAVITAWPSA